MKCRVRFTRGRNAEDFDSIQEAVRALIEEYPNGEMRDTANNKHNQFSSDGDYKTRPSGLVGLYWTFDDKQDPHVVGSVSTRLKTRR